MTDMQIIEVEQGSGIESQEERCREVESEFTPFVGQEFNDVEDAVQFYRIYALACGFDVRRYTTKKWRDGTVKSKILVCNREGFYNSQIAIKDQVEFPGQTLTVDDVLGSRQRRCRQTRIGCKARLRLFHKNGVLVVDRFHDGHNHELVVVKDREFQKLSNNLTLYHKKLILYNSRLAIGATKTYNMCKEQADGFENVGAGLCNFKNFHRDVKCLLHERDGQFFIDHFKKMAEHREDFYFDYDVDEDNSLTRAIWADRTARQNYEAFGDAVSYDPTYRTNKYCMVFTPFTGVDNHKRSVTFCGALIAKENYESFIWVFSRFLEAMRGKEPEYIITDQDPGIIKSVPLVFKTARHRFCMWHIMNKVPVKFGSTRKDYSDFIRKLNNIVWDDEIEPNEFDSRWAEIMEEHDVGNMDWFAETYAIRSQWVMAHCRDLKMSSVMRTTQRSESENSFFKRFIHKSSTLVEFWMRFETAMDHQRYIQKRLDNESKHSTHKLISGLSIENHGSKVYTNEVFLLFQEEVHYSMNTCSVRGFCADDELEVTNVKDAMRDKIFEVKCKPGTCVATCTCGMFERLGILCRHIIWMYSGNGVKNIPEEYVITRWTKDAVRGRDKECNDGLDVIDGKQIRMTELWSEFHNTIGVLRAKDMADVDKLCSLIKDFRLEISPQCEPMNKQQELEQLLGCRSSKEITIHPPKHSKNKGSGKRMLSNKTKAIAKALKPKRMCNHCKRMANHDKRNCPYRIASRPPEHPQSSDENEEEEEEEGVDDNDE